MDNECGPKSITDSKQNKNPSLRACFNEKLYQANKASIAIVMNHFFLRYLNLLYNEFEGDILLPIVLGEIAHHNITNFYSREKNCIKPSRKIETLRSDLKNFKTCNAYSISEATGIPRETVRRKIDKLVKFGWLVKYANSEVVISPTVGEHFMKDFNKELLSEMLEACGCLRELLEER
jgi:hypothetical protein